MTRLRSTTRPALPPTRTRRAIRAALRILGVTLVLAMALYIAYCSVQPFIRGRQLQAEVTRLQQEKADKERVVSDQQQRVGELQTDAGVRREAKRNGMVEPGEQTVEVTYDQPPAPAQAPPTPAAPSPRGMLLPVGLTGLGVLLGGVFLLRRRRRRAPQPVDVPAPTPEQPAP